ncbi:MAG: radical SAM protein [Candidatus Verstraetearchaeota archaeon]|nr:radical SAM protein [Candidatus Verstraetearchaeota archaeon]
MARTVVVHRDKCFSCGVCRFLVACPSPKSCIGCGICVEACPFNARSLMEIHEPPSTVKITVNGSLFEVPRNLTVKAALERLGIFLERGVPQEALCNTGGCYSCLVKINGRYRRACVTPVEEGMVIETELGEDALILRVVHGPQPHSVGGKGTPWYVKNSYGYVEVAIWVAGCNLWCPQCQNFEVTYDGKRPPLTPRQAAEIVTISRRTYHVDRMAISGGEPTVNRRWLVEFFKELKRLNPDERARIHLDSNGTLLTKDYLEELMEAGMTDVGIEPKAARLETYMNITGLKDRELAQRYFNTSWNAVKLVVDHFSDRLFLGVGMAYNSEFMSMEEVREFGEKLASIDREVQLVVLDYFPAFKRQHLRRPSPEEMLQVKRVLEEAGLKTVIVQTSIGHIGP